MSEHIEARKKLKDIASVKTFDSLLELSTLDDTDKEIMRLKYLKGKDFCFIGDTLGFSESTIKRKHAKALAKLSKLF